MWGVITHSWTHRTVQLHRRLPTRGLSSSSAFTRFSVYSINPLLSSGRLCDPCCV